MPDEFGFGIATWPLYSGLVRSFQEVGVANPCLPCSTVFTQIDATHASMPVHAGGSSLSTNFGSSLSTPFGL